MENKTCSRCGEAKPLSEFYKKSRNKDGLSAHCKDCQKVWNKSYYSDNKDAERKRHSEWVENNKSHIRQWGFSYRSDKKEKIAEASKKWRKENPDLVSYHSSKSRATKKNATPSWLSVEQLQDIKSMYSTAKKFEKLFNTKYHVDHIVPLRGKDVCGLHVPWNLQILEANLNVQKSNFYEKSLNI